MTGNKELTKQDLADLITAQSHFIDAVEKVVNNLESIILDYRELLDDIEAYHDAKNYRDDMNIQLHNVRKRLQAGEGEQ